MGCPPLFSLFYPGLRSTKRLSIQNTSVYRLLSVSFYFILPGFVLLYVQQLWLNRGRFLIVLMSNVRFLLVFVADLWVVVVDLWVVVVDLWVVVLDLWVVVGGCG